MTTRPLTRRGALLLGTGALAACGLSTEATAKVSYLAPKASEAFANSPYRQVTDAEWKTRLTPAAYQVLRHEDTERPFTSPLTDEQRAGTFACAGCHLPHFKSDWIFDSGTGWPSFSKPIGENFIAEKTDNKFGMNRTEVVSKGGESHLGHVFDDGPKDKGGRRYCINSASLRFIPKDKLIDEGYGEYLTLFLGK